MFKALKLSSIIFVAVMFIFTLSFSALQACVTIPGKSFYSESCDDKACPMKEAKAKIMQVGCGHCEIDEIVDTTEDVVLNLNIRGMTCAGCEGRVKQVLSSFEGVSGVEVNYKSGKAHLHVEEGKVDNAALIEALKQVGFLASEGK